MSALYLGFVFILPIEYAGLPRGMMGKIILESTITCPKCGYVKTETMPEDACQWFYECVNCHYLLKPLKGDCCVFCSYSTISCPPIQCRENC
ncbi:GDCCVxC domain-containing (seleno)protein [Neptuniibacter pectenicola]